MSKSRRILSGLLAAGLALVLNVPPAWAAPPEPEAEPEPEAAAAEEGVPEETTPAPARYTDVSDRAWYAEAVYFCRAQDLLYGTSLEDMTFEPYTCMSRAMLATILYRLAGEPEAEGDAELFTDVPPESWYGPAALWCRDTGLMVGYGGGIFAPDDTVDRQQIVTTLWRLAGEPAPTGTAEEYLDEDDVASWALEAVRWSRDEQIFPDRGAANFYPTAEIPRCEIAPALMEFRLWQAPPDTVPESWIPPESEELEQSGEPADRTLEEAVWVQLTELLGRAPEIRERPLHDYIREGFELLETEGGTEFMSYREGLYSVGIDVSAHQGQIDWAAVAASGVQFAMIRAGYRGYSVGAIKEDDWYRRNIEGALANGIQVGVYFFSQATTIAEAVEEAEFTLSLIDGYDVSFPVVFDWESGNSDYRTWDIHKNHPEVTVACAIAFCERVKAAGYLPGFYGSRNKLNRLEMGYLADCPCWLAHYTTGQTASNYEGVYDIWQYSSQWRVPGVNGRCDVDVCLTDWTAWREALFGQETAVPAEDMA